MPTVVTPQIGKSRCCGAENNPFGTCPINSTFQGSHLTAFQKRSTLCIELPRMDSSEKFIQRGPVHSNEVIRARKKEALRIRGKDFLVTVTILFSHAIAFGLCVLFSLVVPVTNQPAADEWVGLCALTKAATLMIHADVTIILLMICANSVQTLCKRVVAPTLTIALGAPVRRLFDWCTFCFTILHVVLAWCLSAIGTVRQGYGFMTYLHANLGTGIGWSGIIILIIMSTIRSTGVNQHQCSLGAWIALLFLVWTMHISYAQSPVYALASISHGAWLSSLGGWAIYLIETLFVEFGATTSSSIFKVIEHPNAVIELQMKKKGIAAKAGQVSLRIGFSLSVVINLPRE